MTNQITLPREVVEQMLDALEVLLDEWTPPWEAQEKGKAAITAGRAVLAGAEPTGCVWKKDSDFEMGDTYDSACGEKWSFIDGGPTENRVRFCQWCGNPVKLAKGTP